MRITTVTGLLNPAPYFFLLAQLLFWLLLLGQDIAGATSTCPTPCSCSNQASRVICTRRNLDEVPENISNNTRYLNLQENSIQVNIVLINIDLESLLTELQHLFTRLCVCCLSVNGFTVLITAAQRAGNPSAA